MKPRLLAALALAVPLLLAAPEGGKRLALVVGINAYTGTALTDLAFAENDAVGLAKVLRGECGFDKVVLLTSKEKPTAAAVRAELASLLRAAKRADAVLIALAGHGVQVEVRDPKGEGEPKRYPYFCPSDANLTTVKYATGHSDTMINLDHLFDDLGRSSAGVKLVLMDACRNELKVAGRTRSLAETKVSVPDGVLALLSCGRKQVAYEVDDIEHGLFFHHVIEGLRGKAKDDEGAVTWASLTGYATRNVARDAKKLGKEQSPTATGYYEGETPVLVRPGAATPPPRPKADEKYVTNSVGMKLVKVPAGEFQMGSPADEKDGGADESPRHKVTIAKAFYLGVHEVTQKQFKEVTGKSPSFFSKDGDGSAAVAGLDTSDFPVERVSWEDAKEFCEKLSALPKERAEGRVYRLPTEAEWEYACRAGGASKPFHTGEELTKDDANFGPFLKRTCKVGSYKENAFELHDMHGNVWEWCADWYGDRYYASSPESDPPGPSEGSLRVLRGGCWNFSARFCRSALRTRLLPTFRFQYFGFRAALALSDR